MKPHSPPPAPRPEDDVPVDSIWKHVEGGTYRVLGHVMDATGYETTGQVAPAIRYCQLHDASYPAGTIWVRSRADFRTTVAAGDPKFVRADGTESVADLGQPSRGDVAVGSIWTHVDSGTYEVLGHELNATGYEETNAVRPMVRYRQLYDGEYPTGTVWVRDLEDFQGSIERADSSVAIFTRAELPG